MKKNGYLRKFIAMFLVFVMLMADSSMTTFADVVGRSVQQNAVEDEENGIDLQSADDVNVTVTAPDGTYYVKLKQKENEWWASDIASASVQVQNGKGTCSLDGSNLNDSKENWLEIGLQENGSFVKSGEVLRSEGKIYSVTESNHAFTVNEISIQPGTQRNFKDILGSATNFGIVANEATFKGHLESNFAIGKLNYKGSNVQMSKNEGGGAGYNYIGEFVGSSQLQIGLNGNAGGSVVYAGKGAEGKLTTDNSDLLIDYDTYTEAQIKKIVKDMVDTIKTTSTTLYNENSVPYSAVTDISTSGNQYTDINIAKYGKDAGTYYVSFQPGEFNTFMSNPNRRITIREDQNIVLNVPDTNVDFRQFTFVIVDASGNVVYQKTTNANSDEDRVAENVIFNCPNATTAATYTSTGIFLVPNATFTNAIVSAGWVIANTIAAIGGQEWHNVYKGMPVVETTFQIKATKNVDNAPATDEKYDGKFSFELQEKDGENWKTIDSVTNTGSAIVFDNLGKFGTEGTHYYKIVETASALSDVTIDGEPVYVKAVIKKNGNKMVATVTYYSDENYATEVSDPSFNNTTVITEKTEVSVEKKWADNENQDRVRPGSIQVQLYADETAQGEPIELNEDNGWKYTWSNLEKKSGSNDIEYTVDEVSEPAGYTKTVTVNEARTSYVITNTHTTETTEATVRKVWNDSNDQDGKRPISIIVNLLADGNATGTTVTLNEDNGWAATVNNLPKKANGTDIVYSWSEGNMPEGYSLTDTAKDGTVTTLTNSYSTEETSVSVRKVWTDSDNQDGIRPESISVQLKADGKASGDPVVLNEANNWTYTWTKLAKNANKTEIQYTVDEVDVPSGYTKTVTKESTGYVITNTHQTEKTEATVKKVWDDSNDQDGKRPTSIIVNLLADGNATGTTVTLNEDNGWAATVNNLPKKANGTDIVYSWSEGNMPEGYSLTDTAKDGTVTTLTNSYSTEETSVSVRKVWTDSDNQDGIRPESISVQLKADGKASGDPVVLNEANNWTYTWTKLAKNANKTEIQYTVDEVSVPEGYTKTVTKESTGYVITNTHNPETTSINGTKTWSDNDNQDGKRPTSITVNLLANGTKVDSKEVTANDNWKYEFTNLPKYAAGNEITYTVEEDAVEGYEATVDGYNITNTHKPETTKVEGTKTWNDSDNQDGIRPDSITVNLFANGTKVDSKEVTANDNWKYSFTNLPKYAAGNEIIYTVSEELIDGYEASVNDYNITNTHETEKTEVSGIKSWDDNNNQDGIRPSKITVNLLTDGTKVDSKEVTADNNWKYSFTDLPKYVDGKEIVYTVTEDAVEGYESTVNGSNILNTHIPETTEVSGTKTWNDANDQDGKRPESITVNLLANGEKVNSQVVTAAGNWTYNFTDLPKYKAGKEIKYKVEEVAVADYTTKVEGYDIYNTHTPETTSISGTKTWNDANDQDGKRPKSIKVNLLANGKVVQTKEVTAADNWSYAFNDLPIYEEGKVGQKLTYTISEEAVKDYTTVIDKTNITNSYTPGKIGVSVTKIWDDAGNQDGIRPEKITVKLLADGQDTGKTATLSVDNNWTQSITGLDEKKDGKAIEYTWAEENVPEGYELTGNTADGTVTTLTNKHVPEVTAITGTKTWNDNDDQDGKRPTSITVNLLADGNVYDSKTVTAATNWTYTFNNLPVYENGQKITYAVSEDAVAGYETAIDGFNITNSYTPETTSVSGQKVWDDANNQDGKRPNSIKVRLLANGTEVATKDVTAADNWAYNFTDLPKYANGEEIVYTVTEDAVPDYTTAINGTTITNSYTPGKTSITVTKAWADNDNQDGIRPDSIKVQLYAGEDAQGEEVTLDGTNNWTYTWTGLDAKKAGQDIVYTVKEAGEVTGYTSEISGDAQTGFVITNTHKTEITSVEGKKVWDDADNQDGKRPESIKVRLLANGTEVATKDVTAADNWTYSFTDLPKFADGKEIVYTVTEDAVADYTTAIDGTTITNSYKPGKTSITVTKAWADNDNQDGIRPENIKVQLYAGETAQGEEVTLSADNNWTYTWSELDAKKDGQDIVYTVRETEVPAGYEAIVTGTAAEGFILTNTHETEVISVEGTKTWNDNDQTTKRPESITVRLLADGKEAGSQKVTADSNWTYKFTELPKYAAGKEIIYTVSEDAVPGYITSVNGNNLINTITSVKVSKVDITDHKELAGAHIQILDKDGNIIDEWDSTWEAHEVTGLKTNEQYTLRETVAPDGYTVTSDTTFTLKEDGTVDKDNTQTTVSDDGTLLVEDSKTSVKVSKVDIADGKELEGAHIHVIDEDENIVAEWDSTKEPHVIEGLKTDKKYILRETVAPTGYELTNDTTFVLKADGTVDTEKTTTVFKDGVLLVQDKLATGQSIAVTKKLTTITGDLRAMDQTFYVALYSDEACTQRVSDVKAIEFKNASSSTVVFNENIEVNKDYYIAECSQDGTAQSMGALADGTMYEAKFNNGNKATVKEANGTTTVYFDNVFSSIPDGYYKQGKLTITKKLLGADGNAKKSDNVFYAGIFDDADYTQLSTQVSQNIVKLDLAGGSEVSQVIKIGLDVNKTVTLYVTETDSNGKPVAGTSGFAYKVSVDGSTVTIDEANENASVTITNTENPTTTKTTKTTTEESGNESGSSASSHSMSSSTKAPKTGDDTPIAMYVIILIAAAALIVFGFEKRRRSNRK